MGLNHTLPLCYIKFLLCPKPLTLGLISFFLQNVCGTQVNVAFLFIEVLVMMCLLPCKLVFEWIV